jgi:hypothetical protein
MRDVLAERLLAAVMNWTPEDVARERPDLQALAALKYDDYQQYTTGMRFVESLALWLAQFKSKEERNAAYNFVRTRLLFVSNIEMAHLVTVSFPDFMRPYLVERVATRLGISDMYMTRIYHSAEYATLLRQSLFLGLSDGAHIDLLRRSTPEITHEQVWSTYDIADDKAREMRERLGLDLRHLLSREPTSDERRFKVIFLLDDFSGSGLTYIRRSAGGVYQKNSHYFKGKLAKVFRSVDDGNLRLMVDSSDVHYCLVLYVATTKARDHIRQLADELMAGSPATCTLLIVQLLPDSISLTPETDDPITQVLEAYYDPDVMDEHLRQGGGDVKYGFAGCGLPLVLYHNTPNNSIYLLWAESQTIWPLFPRVSRHRAEA